MSLLALRQRLDNLTADKLLEDMDNPELAGRSSRAFREA